MHMFSVMRYFPQRLGSLQKQLFFFHTKHSKNYVPKH